MASGSTMAHTMLRCRVARGHRPLACHAAVQPVVISFSFGFHYNWPQVERPPSHAAAHFAVTSPRTQGLTAACQVFVTLPRTLQSRQLASFSTRALIVSAQSLHRVVLRSILQPSTLLSGSPQACLRSLASSGTCQECITLPENHAVILAAARSRCRAPFCP